MSSRSETQAAVSAAMLAAGAMIALQVGGKATRDALFLSNFDITDLPTMLIVSSILSIGVVLWTSRAMTRRGPANLIPRWFGLSAVALLAEWAVARIHEPTAAILVYLHISVFGSVLISGFWSIINERFDPRTAKRQISRIAGAGTLGGLVGGLAAERVGAALTVDSMLPVMAGMHLISFLAAGRLRQAEPRRPLESIGEEGEPPAGHGQDEASKGGPEQTSGLAVLRRSSYLRRIGLLVAMGTVAAALVDYVFKEQAVLAYPDGGALIRFFAIFYTAVSLLTFAIQWALSRRVLEKWGLAQSVATLPGAVAIGGAAALVAPGLISTMAARGGEAVLRSSLYRSGYELLYTPVPPKEKRSTKTIIDVGFDRLGDAVGGGVVKLALLLGPATAYNALLGLAIALAVFGLWLARQLHTGYIEALETSLMTRAVELDLDEVEDSTTRSTIMMTLGNLDLKTALAQARKEGSDRLRRLSLTGDSLMVSRSELDLPALRRQSARPPQRTPTVTSQLEPVVEQIVDLRSGDPARIEPILRSGEPLRPELVPHVLPLLAWNEVSALAIRALRRVVDKVTGQLVDALLDPSEEFAIRRRVPPVLRAATSERAVDGLLDGLADKRFEVRFQCGRALARVLEQGTGLNVSEREVFAIVRREVAVERRVWESQRLLDRLEEDEDSPFVDRFLRHRSSRSLEHVFTLLSLVLPKQPLTIAFKGLHTEDEMLRGTALEYLESVLPSDIRDSLWPFLEETRSDRAERRDRSQVLADLLRSNKSIEVKLEALRRRYQDQPE